MTWTPRPIAPSRGGLGWSDQPQFERRHFAKASLDPARIAYWAAMGRLELDEAVALSLGWDPDIIRWHDIQAKTKDWPKARAYADRRRLFDCAPLAELSFPTTLTAVVKWMNSKSLQFPQELATSLEQPAVSGATGRPNSKHLYEAELKRRFEAGTQANTVSQQARDLVAWMESEHSDQPRPKPKAMEDAIRTMYREQRKAANEAR